MKVMTKPMEDDMGENMEEGVFKVKDYPQLDGIEVGHTLEGTWMGKVTAVSKGGDVTVSYDSYDLKTENKADRALAKMKGEKPSKESADEMESEY